jgi:hypothetical protein
MQIEIDFEVWKALTILKETEEMSFSDVLRKLLKLGEPNAIPTPTASAERIGGALFKGVSLPDRTLFRVTYKGRMYTAKTQNGRWIDENGVVRSSPSDAAGAITETQVNGWRFWEVKRPKGRVPCGGVA